VVVDRRDQVVDRCRPEVDDRTNPPVGQTRRHGSGDRQLDDAVRRDAVPRGRAAGRFAAGRFAAGFFAADFGPVPFAPLAPFVEPVVVADAGFVPAFGPVLEAAVRRADGAFAVEAAFGAADAFETELDFEVVRRIVVFRPPPAFAVAVVDRRRGAAAREARLTGFTPAAAD
jgi:hypothetical protein